MTTAQKQTEAVKDVRAKYDQIMGLFDQYNKTESKSERENLISEVSTCLTHVSTVEAEDLYPMFKKEPKCESLGVCEETHTQVRAVLDKLMRLTQDFDKNDYESTVGQLKEAVQDLKNKEENLFKANKL
jgi:hypothetical protein